MNKKDKDLIKKELLSLMDKIKSSDLSHDKSMNRYLCERIHKLFINREIGRQIAINILQERLKEVE
jgi:hypothetical protein